MVSKPTWKVLEGDARDLDVEDGSVHIVLLSPPYWGLRRYLDDDREIGREDTLQGWIDNLITCAREWRRVLRDDGTLWVNCGDAYSNDGKWGGSTGGIHVEDLHGNTGIGRQKVYSGLKPKDLIGLPWRLAFALQADGWYLRNAICWAKGVDWLPNERIAQEYIKATLNQVQEEASSSLFGLSKGLDAAIKRAKRAVDKIMTSGPCMPESVRDRVTSSYEMLFMFSKRERYYFDQTAIRVGLAYPDAADGTRVFGGTNKHGANLQHARTQQRTYDTQPNGGRNPRSVWLLWRCNTEPTGTYILPSGEECSHFAAMPGRLARRAIRCATSQAGVCGTCGSPWERVIEREKDTLRPKSRPVGNARGVSPSDFRSLGQPQQGCQIVHTTTVAWHPSCTCHGSPIPGPIPCEHCRGTGRQRVGIDYEGKWEEGDEQSASRRLLAHTRAARESGADHDVGAGDPLAMYTGDPCPHCQCPDCGGSGQEHVKQIGRVPTDLADIGIGNRYGKVPGSDTRGMPTRDWIGEPTSNPCPTCSGLGSLGYLTGPVWPQETLDNWPRVPATVLDPMCGSGTTLRAAFDLGLSAIGNDLNPAYCRLTRARMEAYPEDVPIKRRSNGTIEEKDESLPLFEAMDVEV